jgi:hypothetical protein
MKRVLFVLAFCFVALTAAWPARANTIFLKCQNLTDPLAVDLTNNTVNGKPVTITPIAIDWDNVNQYGDGHQHIDRATGAITTSGTHYRPDGNIPIPQSTTTCDAVSVPSTKF